MNLIFSKYGREYQPPRGKSLKKKNHVRFEKKSQKNQKQKKSKINQRNIVHFFWSQPLGGSTPLQKSSKEWSNSLKFMPKLAKFMILTPK